MSESRAKVKKRDIRRAFGSAAVGVLDAQGAALEDTVLPLLNVHEKRIDSIADTLAYLRHESTLTRQDLGGHIQYHQTLARMTFGQRLRWLLTGRLP